MSTPVSTSGDPDDLIVLGSDQTLGNYLRELWQRRHFAFALADNDLRAQHMNSVLGQLWHLLNPAMMIGVYFLIFGVVLDARRGVEHYVTFLVTGVIVFRYSQNIIVGCSKSISQNVGLIRSIQFPRALVPISIVLRETMAVLPALLILFVVAIIDGVPLGPELAALPLTLAAGAVFSLGCGFAAARAGSVLTDLQQVLPHFFRIMLYVSGVLFSVTNSIDNQLMRNLFALNPFYDLVAVARWSTADGPIGERVTLGLAGWTVLAIVVGGLYFRKAEHRYGA